MIETLSVEGAVVAALALWCALVACLLLACRRPLLALWREPVLRHPVLVFESDDWGAGPSQQAWALRRLAQVLCRHRDGEGRPAVMTLALVLGRADPDSLAGSYRRRELDHPEHAEVLAAIREGVALGCFAPQLHGHEHYWPAALLTAAAGDQSLRAWLAEPQAPTEHLPSPLQSRWTDASRLPSVPLEEGAIRSAVAEEVRAYARILGCLPRVVVPPTFVWDARVELAWASQGIGTVVTPGQRYSARDAQGLPAGCWGETRNGGTGAGGVRYVVREDYFEPAFGHRADRVLEALARCTAQGRPTLMETHRLNFIGAQAQTEAHLRELDRSLGEALRRHPGLRFLATEALAEALVRRDPAWCHTRLRPRLAAWVARLRGQRRFWRLARLLGLAPLLRLLEAA